MNWIPRFLRRHEGVEAGETGEQNAQRFAKMVVKVAHEDRVIICDAGRGYNERYGWLWMMNAAWRERVMELLQGAPIKDARFCPPDDMEGWTFSAYSTVPVPRIAQLTLEDIL